MVKLVALVGFAIALGHVLVAMVNATALPIAANIVAAQ